MIGVNGARDAAQMRASSVQRCLYRIQVVRLPQHSLSYHPLPIWDVSIPERCSVLVKNLTCAEIQQCSAAKYFSERNQIFLRCFDPIHICFYLKSI